MKLNKLVLVTAISCISLNIFIYSSFPGAFSKEAWQDIWLSAAHGLLFYFFVLISFLSNFRWSLFVAAIIGITLIPIDLRAIFQTNSMPVSIVPAWQIFALAILELLLTLLIMFKLTKQYANSLS